MMFDLTVSDLLPRRPPTPRLAPRASPPQAVKVVESAVAFALPTIQGASQEDLQAASPHGVRCWNRKGIDHFLEQGWEENSGVLKVCLEIPLYWSSMVFMVFQTILHLIMI